MKNSSRVANIICKRRVVEQNGSWKWQDAYRVTTYQAHLADNGKVIWSVLNRGPKSSMPQLRRQGLAYIPPGGLYLKQVPRDVAIKYIGACAVRRIENHGWRFASGTDLS